MSHRLDDPSALLSLLQQWTAPPEVKSRLEASGFTTLGLLGHALPSADKEDSFIITVLGLDPNNPALLHSAAAACLRRLLAAARDLCPSAPAASPSALPSGSAQPALVKLSPTDLAPEISGELPGRAPYPGGDACSGVPVRAAAHFYIRSLPLAALEVSLHRG